MRPRGARDRDLAPALRLLEANQTGALSIDTLREHGIEVPALAMYELQLAGQGYRPRTSNNRRVEHVRLVREGRRAAEDERSITGAHFRRLDGEPGYSLADAPPEP